MMKGANSRSAKPGQQQPIRRRRKKYKAPPGQPSDSELVAAWLAKQEVTKCPPGYAIGSLPHSCHGLD